MRKFIITSDGVLKYGDVQMHKDLLAPGDFCIGGGFYDFDYVGNRLLLSGKSYDFGRPKWHYIDCLLAPKAFQGMRILYDDIELPVPVRYA